MSQDHRETRSLTTDIAIGLAPAAAVVAGKVTDHLLSRPAENTPTPQSDSAPPAPADDGAAPPS